MSTNDVEDCAVDGVWCQKFPTNSSTEYFTKLKCVSGLLLFCYLVILCIMYALMSHISIPQKNNFLHHLRDFRRKQYVAAYWSVRSTALIFFGVMYSHNWFQEIIVAPPRVLLVIDSRDAASLVLRKVKIRLLFHARTNVFSFL